MEGILFIMFLGYLAILILGAIAFIRRSEAKKNRDDSN
jgi:cbb3-type cytochrome oxidase subunit 3